MLSVVRSDPLPPPPASFNMAAYVLAHAERLADKPALEVVGRDVELITYRALRSAVLSTATGLLAQGLRTGDRVLVQLGNRADFPIAYLAAIAVGLIPVPLSSQLTEREVGVVAEMVGPKLRLQAESTATAGVPVVDSEALRSFRDLPQAAFDLGDPNRPAYIVFTSGTSGAPRAVVHAHRAIWARRMMWEGWYGLRETDRLMHAGAFNWTYTLGTGLMDPWSVGATALIPADGTPYDHLGKLLAAHDATLFAAAPGVYRRLLRGAIPALPRLRHGLSAGEKLSPADRAAWTEKTKAPIHEAFGMSECSTFISSSPQNPAPSHAAGFVQPGRHVALLGADGPVPRGTPGVIAVHRDDPGLMLGYWNDAERTARSFQGPWFLTGDVGIMDDCGAIAYQGRNDDMMNAGGMRVSPVEVENAMCGFHGVSEAAACAVQVRTGVTVIAGFYVSADVVEEEALQSFLKTQLAHYKIPRFLIACDTLPRGANNKLLRATLRERWEAENGQT